MGIARLTRDENRRARLREWFSERPIPASEKSYISQLVNGKASFGEKAARRLEETYEMPTGFLDTPVEYGNVMPRMRVETPVPDYGDEIVLIPFIDAALSAGPGVQNHTEEVRDLHQYTASWVAKRGLLVPALRRVKIVGDSMRPTLWDGDVALVNTAEKRITNGKVYAYLIDGEARVKRLWKQFDGKIRVSSDNPDKSQYPDEFLTPDTMPEMIGRVVDRSGGADL